MNKYARRTSGRESTGPTYIIGKRTNARSTMAVTAVWRDPHPFANPGVRDLEPVETDQWIAGDVCSADYRAILSVHALVRLSL